MKPLHQIVRAAVLGTLCLGAFAMPASAAAPTTYDATGPVMEMTDTTLTIMFHGKEKWTFARDATTKGAETIKVGDKITVHYTMMAGSVDVAKATAETPAKGGKKVDKKVEPAASPAAAAVGSPAVTAH